MGAGASSSTNNGQLAMKIAQKFSLKQENYLFFPHEFHENPSVFLTHHFKTEKINNNDENNSENYIKISFYDKIYIELIEKYFYRKEKESLLNFPLHFHDYHSEFLYIKDLHKTNEQGWTLLHSFCLPGVGGIKNSIVFNEFLESFVSGNIVEDDLNESITSFLSNNKIELIKNDEEIFQNICKFDNSIDSIINQNTLLKNLKYYLIKENLSLYNQDKCMKKNILYLNNYLKKLFDKQELLINNFHYEGSYSVIELIFEEYELKKKENSSVETLLNAKTIRGPGTFHFGWTPLHMACAYNLIDIAKKLLEYKEVDVNAPTDDFYYTPLYEACHRNYHEIVRLILDTDRADLFYIPPFFDDSSNSSGPPRLPPQSYLAEASRYGHIETVNLLLEAGAPIDLTNDLGWTALHEASFHGYSNIVKVLLEKGANAFLINSQGLYPYHLTNNKEILELLPSKNTLDDDDMESPKVDTLDVLMGLALLDLETATAMRSQSENRGNIFSLSYSVENNHEPTNIYDNFFIDEIVYEGMEFNEYASEEILVHPTMIRSLSSRGITFNEEQLSSKNNDINNTISSLNMTKKEKNLQSPLPPIFPKNNLENNIKKVESESSSKKNKSNPINNSNLYNIIESLKPEEIPVKFLCQLTKKIMTSPLKSLYGHTFEEKSIKTWFKFNGRICPITGCPLSESDLTPLPSLTSQIKQFLINIYLENSKEKKVEDIYEF